MTGIPVIFYLQQACRFPKLIMNQAFVCFHPEYNFFLLQKHKENWFPFIFQPHQTIKDVIESLGVPHTEIAAILVNNQLSSFSYFLNNRDRVYIPSFHEILEKGIASIQEDLPQPQFILDVHLGKLAGYLRLLGFDSLFNNSEDDLQLAKISSEQNRCLLTRDRGLLMRKIIKFGHYVRSTDPQQQILEVLLRFDLVSKITPFTRCQRCNGILKPVSKSEIQGQLEPETKTYYNDFQICLQCGQIYWKGSHFTRLNQFVDRIRSAQHQRFQ